MIDEDKILISKLGQVFSREKIRKVTATQKEILHLIDNAFDNERDFQYINFMLALVHANKLKDFILEANLREESMRVLLVEHATNTLTIVKEGEFQYTDTRKK